jgi:hypothetical protein
MALIASSSVLSILASVLIISHRENIRSDEHTGVVRANAFELVDSSGNVRAKLGLQIGKGASGQPYLTLLDNRGLVAAAIALDRNGNGTLGFSRTKEGYEREGVVLVGFIASSDVLNPGESDPFGAWGIRVNVRPGNATAFGTFESGLPLGSQGAK